MARFSRRRTKAAGKLAGRKLSASAQAIRAKLTDSKVGDKVKHNAGILKTQAKEKYTAFKASAAPKVKQAKTAITNLKLGQRAGTTLKTAKEKYAAFKASAAPKVKQLKSDLTAKYKKAKNKVNNFVGEKTGKFAKQQAANQDKIKATRHNRKAEKLYKDGIRAASKRKIKIERDTATGKSKRNEMAKATLNKSVINDAKSKAKKAEKQKMDKLVEKYKTGPRRIPDSAVVA